MTGRKAWAVVTLLVFMAAPALAVSQPNGGHPSLLSGSSAAVPFESRIVPAQQPPRLQFAAAGSGNDDFWVGAQASDWAAPPNEGARTTIQVVDQQVTGCLSYWVSEEASSGTWGQVGYYICNGDPPVAFYQIWSSGSVQATGTVPVTSGYHQFSMYVQSADTWAFALDGSVFGSYDMGANVSSSTYPVQALSEEGYVSAPWNPVQVEFETAIQLLESGSWTPVQSAFAFSSPPGCSAYQMSCWGLQGDAQNASIGSDAMVVGGNASGVMGGSALWNDTAASSDGESAAAAANGLPVPTVNVSCSHSSVVVGATVECKATVLGSTSTPTGKVSWSTNGTGRFPDTICQLSKVGACSVRFVPSDASSSLVLTASYSGDSKDSPSTGTYVLYVLVEQAKITVSCTRSQAAGSPGVITCTARVKGYHPTGIVNWSQSGTGSVSFTSLQCTLLKGTCAVTMTAFASGHVTIVASYEGDTNDKACSASTRLTIG